MKTAKNHFSLFVTIVMVLLYTIIIHGCLNDSTTRLPARQVKISIPPESNSISYFIDSISSLNLDGHETLFVKGWLFNKHVQSAEKRVFLVLRSKSEPFVFMIEKDTINRADVSASNQLAGGINNFGFEAYIPLNQLKKDSYRLSFVLWDERGIFHTMTEKEITISDGSVEIANSNRPMDTRPFSTRISLRIKSTTTPAKFAFDEFNLTENHLKVRGWAYLEGMNTDFLETFLVLIKGTDTIIYALPIEMREDVTKANQILKLNLDKSGFSGEFLFDNIDQGQYEINLYLSKGEDVCLVSTNRRIDLK